MSMFVKSILACTVMVMTSAQLQAQATNNEAAHPSANVVAAVEDEIRNAVLHFRITEENFQIFRQVASHRQSSRLQVLPGFPENPTLDRAMTELAEDADTREQLGRGNLSPRDYVLTGWALILAHDPDDWGLSGDRLTDAMRGNVEFVRTHAESVDALLRSD